jgi:hypothetical protein
MVFGKPEIAIPPTGRIMGRHLDGEFDTGGERLNPRNLLSDPSLFSVGGANHAR